MWDFKKSIDVLMIYVSQQHSINAILTCWFAIWFTIQIHNASVTPDVRQWTLTFLRLRSSEHSGKCVLHGPTSLCYVRTHQHLWTEISFISSGSIPPNSTLHFEVVLDDAWISPFKYETTFKPEGCDKNMRKTALGDRISIHYNGSIDRNSSAVFYETWVLRNF